MIQYHAKNIPNEINPRSLGRDYDNIIKINVARAGVKTYDAVIDSTAPLPSRIRADRKPIDLQSYKPEPKRCTKCQGLDHFKAQCRKKTPKCAICAEGHWSSVCFEKRNRNQPVTNKCANCSGSHSAAYRGCPAFRKAAEALAPKPQALPTTKAWATSQSSPDQSPVVNPQEAPATNNDAASTAVAMSQGPGDNGTQTNTRGSQPSRGPRVTQRHHNPNFRSNLNPANRDRQDNRPPLQLLVLNRVLFDLRNMGIEPWHCPEFRMAAQYYFESPRY